MQNLQKKSKTKSQRKWNVLTTFSVAGLQYNDFNPRYVKRGTKLKLVWEKANPHDPLAIRIELAQGEKRVLGYVPRGLTHTLHEARWKGTRFFAFVNQIFKQESIANMVWVRVKTCEATGPVVAPKNFVRGINATDDSRNKHSNTNKT